MQITQQIRPSIQVNSHYQKSPEFNEGRQFSPEEKQQTSEKTQNFQTLEKVEKQINGINKVLESNLTSLKFNLHEETDRYFVQVQDQKTKEVIKEIPSEEFLDMMARITEYTGILINTAV